MLAEVLDFSGYSLSANAVPTILVGLAVFGLGLFALVRERISLVSISFFLITLSVSVWLFSYSWLYSATDERPALWWARAAYLGIPFIAAATYQFTVTVLRIYARNRRVVWAGWFIAALFSGLGMSSDLIVEGVELHWWGYYPRYSLFGLLFIGYFFAMLIASMGHYWFKARKAPPDRHRRRIRSLMLAFGIGYIGCVDFVAAYGIPLYPFGYLAILGFIAIALRAIVTYRLVDITPAFAANQIVHTMKDALVVLDDEGVVRLVNRAACDLFGLGKRDLIGKPVAATIDAGMRSGGLSALVGADDVDSSEMVYSRREGERRVLSVSATVMCDANEEQVGTVCIARDITERRRAEEVINESKERYRAVVEQTSEGIYLADAQTKRFIEANVAFQRMVGYSLEELQGLTVYDIMAHDREKTDHDIGRILHEGSSFFGERRYACKDGSSVDVEVSINIISHVGREVMCAAVHDITDRRRAQERITRQLQRLAALRNIDMAISASVDLRVTLSVIVDQVTTHLRVDASSVLLLDPHAQTLEYAAGRGFRSETIMRTRLRLGEGYAGRAALERRTITLGSRLGASSSSLFRSTLRVQDSELTVGVEENGAAPAQSQPSDAGHWTLDPGGDDSGFLNTRLMSREGFMAYYAVPLVAKGHVKGVLEIFHRSPLDPDPEWLAFLEALGGQAAIAIDNATLFEGLERSNFELALAYDTTLAGWSRALDLRDEETEGHSQRVTEMTLLLANAMGMSEAELVHVRRGALLHDIGKMGIPDSILLKPGPLDDEELVVMRRHPEYAFRLLSPISYLRPSLDIPYCHHEKWDGSGYPRGLKGEEIPLAARIFAVVDVWDALSSDRPYRKAWPPEKVREHIRAGAGSHFDPRVVEVFLKVLATHGRHDTTRLNSGALVDDTRTIPLDASTWQPRILTHN